MYTVALIAQNGGPGKTTLAVAAGQVGMTSIIVDLDPQATACDWKDRRKEDGPVVIDAQPSWLAAALDKAAENGLDFAVIDMPPQGRGSCRDPLPAIGLRSGNYPEHDRDPDARREQAGRRHPKPAAARVPESPSSSSPYPGTSAPSRQRPRPRGEQGPPRLPCISPNRLRINSRSWPCRTAPRSTGSWLKLTTTCSPSTASRRSLPPRRPRLLSRRRGASMAWQVWRERQGMACSSAVPNRTALD